MVRIQKKINKKLLLTLSLVVILLGIMIFVFVRANKVKPTSSTITSITPTSTNPTDNSNKQTPGAEGYNSSPKTSGTTSTIKLLAPSGTFVSNHKPNLSGSPAPTTEQSVCNTTPGAACYIEFRQNDEVKQLKAQATDSKGTAYWSWDINKAGFTPGTWKITAVSTLNGQTKTTSDPIAFEVAP